MCIIRKDVCDTCNKGTRVLDVCQAKAVGWAMGIGLNTRAFEYSKLVHAQIPPALEKAPVKCRREGGGGGSLPRAPRSLRIIFFSNCVRRPFRLPSSTECFTHCQSVTVNLYCTILTHMGKKIRGRDI